MIVSTDQTAETHLYGEPSHFIFHTKCLTELILSQRERDRDRECVCVIIVNNSLLVVVGVASSPHLVLLHLVHGPHHHHLMIEAEEEHTARI